MGLFSKKNAKSGLRFCQSAKELDTLHLFSSYDLTLALSNLTEWRQDALQPASDAYGYGVVHQPYGGDDPLLPVIVQFCFSPPHREGEIGNGSIGKKDWLEQPYYVAEIFIFDPDRRVFDGFQKAFERAVISGSQYAHLVLRRRKLPHVADLSEREAAHRLSARPWRS